MKKYYSLLLILLLAVLISACKETINEVEKPTDYDKADGINGGIRYDKFWSTEADYSKKGDTDILAKLNAKADFFRCKQCHGWDLVGTKGSYINRAPNANRPNISGMDLVTLAKTKTGQELFDAIKKTAGRRDISFDLTTYDPSTNATEGDKMPNYTQLLTDAEIWDIVKFLKVEALDLTLLYDLTLTGTYPTGRATFSNIGKDGDAPVGKTYYGSKCASCHGADGTQLQMESMTLGKFLRTKANESQHKIKFGQLGSAMTAFKTGLQDMKNLYKAVSDTVAFPN
ncbi:MAG: c-type cytochrome [Ignavibacteriaceae bacterium]|nr:c-type cytochrome [Ignavibacteriaceae bacterium]